MFLVNAILIASYVNGGVIVDLETGNYFRVDRTAACVCEVLRDSKANSPYRMKSPCASESNGRTPNVW